MKLKPFRYLFLLLVLLYTLRVTGQEQNFDGCLNYDQLYQLYNGNSQSMGQMMGKQRFFMVSNEKDISFAWMDDTLTMDLYNWQFSMGFNDIYVNVLHKDGFYNFVEYNTSANCANKLLQECKAKHMEQYDDLHDSTHTQKDMDSLLNPIQNKYQRVSTQLTFDYIDGCRFIFPEEKTGNGHFLIQVYNPSNFNQLVRINKTQQEQELIARRIKEQTILSHIAAADSLAKIEEFPTAIQLLEEVYDLLPDYMTTVDAKLGTIKRQYKDKKIQNYTEEGNRLYELGDYNGALTMYDNVLKEDMNNRNALERIDIINRKLDVLHQRSQVTFDYKETNPKNYIDFRGALSDELNKLIENTSYGNLRMNYSILFDTMAINQSFYNIHEFNTIALEKNQTILQTRMSNLLGHNSLQPSYREEIPIRSATEFKLDLKWDSFSQMVVKKRKKLVNKSSYPLNPMIEDALKNDPRMHYGKYFFENKSKNCNDRQFNDISLTKYHTVGGEAFIYGLFPGLGTLIATQGKEGATCMVLSLLSYGGATASYVLFKKYKQEYNETAVSLSEKEAKTLKTKREICKWSAIAGVSIGGTIHLSGMIKAMVRGIQNKKASKELRQALQNEPIEINKENIQIQ